MNFINLYHYNQYLLIKYKQQIYITNNRNNKIKLKLHKTYNYQEKGKKEKNKLHKKEYIVKLFEKFEKKFYMKQKN